MNMPMYSDGAELPLATLIDARHTPVEHRRTHRMGTGPWMGPFRGLNRGQGLDFDDLRPYVEGDDIRHIDWKVTARFNTPHTRLYREEKDSVVTLTLDFRSCMFTGSTELRAVQTGKVAAILLWKIVQSGGRCNIVTLRDHKVQSIRPSVGERGALAGCKFIADEFALAKFENNRHSKNHAAQETQQGFQSLIEQLLEQGRSTGNIILIGGFDSSNKELTQSLRLLKMGSHHSRDICAIHTIDPIEIDGIPSGSYSYHSAKKAIRIQLRKKQSGDLKKALNEQRAILQQLFGNAKITYFDTEPGIAPCVSKVLGLGWVA